VNPLRRTLLRAAAGAPLAALLAAGLLRPGRVLASPRNDAAFEARTLAEALHRIGADQASPSTEIQIKAPEIAENGAVVSVEVMSNIPATRRIAIVADKNPLPLILQVDFAPGVKPQLATRIKMAETSMLRAVVVAGDKTYTAFREVKVTLGGCGS
jgi:sulfur-oxidizing protein SoxY